MWTLVAEMSGLIWDGLNLRKRHLAERKTSHDEETGRREAETLVVTVFVIKWAKQIDEHLADSL